MTVLPRGTRIDEVTVNGFADREARPLLQRLAELDPRMLARMHGSAWRGDGKSVLLAFADNVEKL